MLLFFPALADVFLSVVFQPITDDDVDRISTCIRVLAEHSPLMYSIFNEQCRQSLSTMLSAKAEEDKLFQLVSLKLG